MRDIATLCTCICTRDRSSPFYVICAHHPEIIYPRNPNIKHIKVWEASYDARDANLHTCIVFVLYRGVMRRWWSFVLDDENVRRVCTVVYDGCQVNCVDSMFSLSICNIFLFSPPGGAYSSHMDNLRLNLGRLREHQVSIKNRLYLRVHSTYMEFRK